MNLAWSTSPESTFPAMESCRVFFSPHSTAAWCRGPGQGGGGGGLRSALDSAVDRRGNLSGLCNASTCLYAKQTRRGGLLTQLSCEWFTPICLIAINFLLLFNVLSEIRITKIKMEDTSYKSKSKTRYNRMHLMGLLAVLNLTHVPVEPALYS